MTLIILSSAFASVVAGYVFNSPAMYFTGIGVMCVQWVANTKGAAKATPDVPSKSKTL